MVQNMTNGADEVLSSKAKESGLYYYYTKMMH